MSEQLGGKFAWQRLTRLVATGTVTVGGFPGTPTLSNTVEVTFGNDPQLAPDDTPDVPGDLSVTPHAYYVPSAVCRDPSVTVYVQGPGLSGVQFDVDAVVVSVFRRFIPGPPGRWRSGLRFCNFTSASKDVEYRVYRLFGLV